MFTVLITNYSALLFELNRAFMFQVFNEILLQIK